jgi:hypothetical protein
MDDQIWKSVIDELGEASVENEVMPYYYGEPLLNPRLYEVCEYIADHAPKLRISISTNGSLLTDENIEKLLRVRRLYFLNFSVYAGTKESYERVMGLDYTTLDRVEKAVHRFQTERPEVNLCLGATNDPRFVTRIDCEELIHRFGCKVSFHAISFNYQHGALHNRDYPDERPCQVPFANCVVFSDGKVGLCCFDVNGDLIFGDVTKTSFWKQFTVTLRRSTASRTMPGLKMLYRCAAVARSRCNL